MTENKGFFLFLKKSIPGTIWAIGCSSLLINTATSVIFSGSALYLKTVLGVTVSTIGFIEAIVEAIAYAVRIFSGVISDYLMKRKRLIVIGFIMIVISKPLLAISKSFVGVFFARAMDRVGNGIQASPRDALISDAAAKDVKGACFGLRQSLAVIGSTLGGVFGIVVMKLSNNNFSLLFYLAGIPAILATVILILFVKEKKYAKIEHKKRKIKLADLKLLGKKFWVLMAVVSIVMLARFSEIFISLHACGNFGLDLAYVTAITTIYNLMSTFVAYPVGKISDKCERTYILGIGLFILILAHLSIGFANSLWVIFIGTIFWGIQRGIVDSILVTLVSDYVPKDLRGTGYGIYYLFVSASTAVASAAAGIISQQSGEATTFIYGSMACSLALFLLFIFNKILKTNKY